MESGNKKTIFQVLLFVATFSLAFYTTKTFFGKSSERKIMEQKIDSLNKALPIVYENFIRADKVAILNGDTLEYKMTFISIDENSPKILVDALKYDCHNKCQKTYDTAKGMKAFRDAHVIIKYSYNGKHGKPLFNFVVQSDKKE